MHIVADSGEYDRVIGVRRPVQIFPAPALAEDLSLYRHIRARLIDECAVGC